MNAEPSSFQIPPPKDWQVFERHMRDLLEAEWQAPAEMHGRTGQPQCGVDIYGQPKGAQGYHGVQCKGRGRLCQSSITEKELRDEVDKAQGFRPGLAHFILATTGPGDVRVQEVARELSIGNTVGFSVRVMFWDDILHLYDRHPDVFDRHYSSLRRQVTPIHQLRAPTADFQGRKEELEMLLSLAETGASISGLQGLGGVGKTELALVVADRLLHRYPDAQFFIELKGTSDKPLPPDDALLRIIKSIRPDAELPHDLAERRDLYRSMLHGVRAIILADDAASAEQVLPLLPPSSCLMLVTSRYLFTVPGFVPLRLDCLLPEDARGLILKICPRADAEAAIIARACGYLPLALRAAASLLAVRGDIRPLDYVKELADEQRKLETIGQEGVDMGVEASLMLTYRQLNAKVARVLQLLSVFVGTFDAQAEEVVCRDVENRCLGELVRYSMVGYDERSQRYGLHDLVRVFACRLLDQPSNSARRFAAQRRHAVHYAKALGLDGGTNKDYRGEADNFWAAYRWATEWAGSDVVARRLRTRYRNATAFVVNIGLNEGPGSLKYTKMELKAARDAGDRQAEGETLGILGSIYSEQGDTRRAIVSYEKQLLVLRRIGDRKGEAYALLGLAKAHGKADQLSQAVECFEQSLPILRDIGDASREGTTLYILGQAYQVLGKLHRAIEYYEQSLPTLRTIGDRHTEGGVLYCLGGAYAILGDLSLASEYYEQSLVILREIGDRCKEATALRELGYANSRAGNFSQAVKHYEQALLILREMGDREQECNAIGALGWAWAELGDAQRALEHLDQYLAISRELGDRSAEAKSSYVRSYVLYYVRRRWADAIEEAEVALRIFEDVGDSDTERVLRQTLDEWRGERHTSNEGD